MQLKGRTVFVTGAASGIGKATVEAVLREGAKAVIADVNEKAGEELAASLQDQYGKDHVIFVKCDVSDEDSFTDAFKSAVEKFGHLDVVINNAGFLNESTWKKMIAVNFNGVVLGTQLAVEHMRKDKGGNGGIIINIASIVGLKPGFSCPVYAGTKHAVVGFTRSWAEGLDVPKMGIRFGIICPDPVDTAFYNFPEEAILYPDMTKRLTATVGFISASRVAEGILKLVADDKSNGAILPATKDEFMYKTPVLENGIQTTDISAIAAAFSSH